MTGVLLDTCAAIWLLDGSRMRRQAYEALTDEHGRSRPFRISPISAWEVAMLSIRGRLAVSVPPIAWYRQLKDHALAREMPLDEAVLVGSHFLPGTPPRDPADRIIISTAREHRLTVLTRDRLILDYAEKGHVLALAC